MRTSLGQLTLRTFKIVVVVTPWVIAMYTFYWLDSSGTWTSETAHRGKMSVAILAAGMILSFLIWSSFAKHEQHRNSR
jgi:hypothetical protein